MTTGAMTHGVLPEGVAFQGKRTKDGRYRFTYSESFNDRTLVERTADLLRHAFKAMADSGLRINHRLTRGGGSFTIKGAVTSETLGNMMVGEFLAWSTIGAMRLRDLLAQAVVTGAGGVSASNRRRLAPNANDRRRVAESVALSGAELRRLANVPAFPPGFEAEFKTEPVNLGVGVGEVPPPPRPWMPTKPSSPSAVGIAEFAPARKGPSKP